MNVTDSYDYHVNDRKDDGYSHICASGDGKQILVDMTYERGRLETYELLLVDTCDCLEQSGSFFFEHGIVYLTVLVCVAQ